MIQDLIIYLISFAALWVGSGLVVSSVEKFAKDIKIKSFIISFFVLGILTSVTEFFVTINSIIEKKPEVAAGNLLGGIAVIFLFIFPIVAIGSNGVKLLRDLNIFKLVSALAVVALPSILIFDGKVNLIEGSAFILGYIALTIIIQKQEKVIKNIEKIAHKPKKTYEMEALFIIVGLVMVFIASHFIVDKTLLFSEILHVPAFLVSLFVLSIGTNIPEISIALRSLVNKSNEVAIGDYLGSAAANTLIFGILVIGFGEGIEITDNNFYITTFFIIISLILFFFFALTKKNISRREGVILLLVFIAFILSQSIIDTKAY